MKEFQTKPSVNLAEERTKFRNVNNLYILLEYCRKIFAPNNFGIINHTATIRLTEGRFQRHIKREEYQTIKGKELKRLFENNILGKIYLNVGGYIMRTRERTYTKAGWIYLNLG
ncbi:LOW QUALITY PROTEIN: hypothetical protein HZS_5893 [Henneguya salminicola]|nr:LOW QUALITY PROTEIN: hypothetical protein HZS_5893 [Henneguya salminicola]